MYNSFALLRLLCIAIGPKLLLNSNLAISRFSIASVTVVQSFCKFAQRTAVILPCSVQNFKMIGWLINKLWTNTISRDLGLRWVSDGYPTFAQHPGWIRYSMVPYNTLYCTQHDSDKVRNEDMTHFRLTKKQTIILTMQSVPLPGPGSSNPGHVVLQKTHTGSQCRTSVLVSPWRSVNLARPLHHIVPTLFYTLRSGWIQRHSMNGEKNP